MHTINDCPRCGKDFMYHQTDTHLFRDLKSNEEIKNEYPIQDEQWASRRWSADRTESCDLSGGYDVICQDCDEIENIAEFIKEKAEHRGWENAEYMAGDKFGVDKTLEAIHWLDKNDASSQNGL
jgi:hypothetical protein